MSDQLPELEAIRECVAAATPGPWWFDENERTWRLHGVAGVVPPQLDGLIPEQVVNHQILKAPKQGTPYAEYWPNDADAAFITGARTWIPLLLAAVDAVLADHTQHVTRNFPEPGICSYDRLRWPCPTVQDIIRALRGEATADA